MRAVPDSVVLYPCDAVSTHKLVGRMIEYVDGISYLRTTRAATPVVYDETENFEIGGCKVLRRSEQDSVCIIAAGITVFEALKAHDELRKEGISVSVIDCYSVKPLDTETIMAVAKASGGKIITVEDHYLEGGMGEAICYAVRNKGFRTTCLAVTKLPRSGEPSELMVYEEIDSTVIMRVARSLVHD
jgi:transketolase